MKGILFIPEMVVAIQDGRKTMTRRMESTYKSGEILYVKEAYYAFGDWKPNGKTKTGKPAYKFVQLENVDVRFDKPHRVVKGFHGFTGWYKRPRLFMPAAAARTFIQVTDIRQEKLWDISEEDAKKEGIRPESSLQRVNTAFHYLWQSINGNWNDNPIIYVITFRIVQP